MVSLLDLPNELLEETAYYCRFGSLLKLSETCKRFNEIVFQNSRLRNRIHLRLRYNRKGEITTEPLMESKRVYSNLCIEVDPSHNIDFSIIKKFGENIKYLKISGKIEFSDLEAILHCCPNVEEMCFRDLFTSKSHLNIENRHRPNLKKLTFNDSDLETFKVLHGAQLTHLAVDYYKSDWENINMDDTEFVKFFQAQEKLESLSLGYTEVAGDFSAVDFSKNLKRLKKLSVTQSTSFLFHNKTYNNLSKCIEDTTGLVEVEIEDVDFLSAADYDHLLTKNPMLKTLTLKIRKKQKIRKYRQYTSVKNLNLHFMYKAEKDLYDLVTQFPNVEKLELIGLRKGTLKLVAQTMPNLTKLIIVAELISFNGVKFPSLKSLCLISRQLEAKNFKTLLENNKQITHLKIMDSDNLSTDYAMQLIVDNLKDLETLEIGGVCRFKFTKAIFPMIAGNLKKLKLFKAERWSEVKLTKNDMAPLNLIPGLQVFTNFITR